MILMVAAAEEAVCCLSTEVSPQSASTAKVREDRHLGARRPHGCLAASRKLLGSLLIFLWSAQTIKRILCDSIIWWLHETIHHRACAVLLYP